MSVQTFAYNLRNTLRKGANIATVVAKTPVKTAAKYNHLKVEKVSRTSAMLFNSLADYTDAYLNKVKRTTMHGDSTDFEKSETYFEHTSCYSITRHKKTDKLYLAIICNKSLSTAYYVDGVEVAEEKVNEMLTPSALAAKNKDYVYNVKNDVIHKAIFRNISLENIISVTTNGKTLVL